MNRAHVNVRYRHGYFVNVPRSTTDRRLLASAAVMSAVADRARQDFSVTAAARDLDLGVGASPTVGIQVSVDTRRLTFSDEGPTGVAPLDVAVFLTGPKGPLPTSWHLVASAYARQRRK